MDSSKRTPAREFDLEKKMQFLRRLRNKRIANKIMRTREFREYDDYSLENCMTKALELEDEYQVGELVTDDLGQVMVVEEEIRSEGEEVCPLESMNPASARNKTKAHQTKISILVTSVGGQVILLKNVPTQKGQLATPHHLLM